jgi:hypothetical protein
MFRLQANEKNRAVKPPVAVMPLECVKGKRRPGPTARLLNACFFTKCSLGLVRLAFARVRGFGTV